MFIRVKYQQWRLKFSIMNETITKFLYKNIKTHNNFHKKSPKNGEKYAVL